MKFVINGVTTIVIVNYDIPLVADYIRGICGSAITPVMYRRYVCVSCEGIYDV